MPLPSYVPSTAEEIESASQSSLHKNGDYYSGFSIVHTSYFQSSLPQTGSQLRAHYVLFLAISNSFQSQSRLRVHAH